MTAASTACISKTLDYEGGYTRDERRGNWSGCAVGKGGILAPIAVSAPSHVNDNGDDSRESNKSITMISWIYFGDQLLRADLCTLDGAVTQPGRAA